jgi:triphosphoribosyl-dephospho-CoA synthetase
MTSSFCSHSIHQTYFIQQEDNAELVRELSEQLGELLKANKELREENERLRHIY